jgi:hypothetical protein
LRRLKKLLQFHGCAMDFWKHQVFAKRSVRRRWQRHSAKRNRKRFSDLGQERSRSGKVHAAFDPWDELTEAEFEKMISRRPNVP